MSRPKKRPPEPRADSPIKSTKPADEKVRFSFELFDGTDRPVCPEVFPEGYTQKLMERLCAVSQMKEQEFRACKDKSLRAHTHEWNNTSRPNGFAHLNDQLKDLQGWQFCLSANEYGRVHGLMIDNVFYVIWLDVNHALYPSR
jgi:hypothetical protein